MSKTKTPGKAPVVTLSTSKEIATGKLYTELKNTIGDFLAAGVLDEHDMARVLLTLLASLRVECDGATGITEIDEILTELGTRAGMRPIPEQPLQ